MRTLLLIVALSVCNYAWSDEPTPTPLKSSKQPENKTTKSYQVTINDKQGTKESPFFIVNLPAINADEITKRKNEQEDEKSTLDKLIAFSTVALAVITFFLALFTAFLWASTRALVKDARETSKVQLRSYLGIEHGFINLLETGNTNIIKVKLSIKNTGQTPAYSVTARRTLEFNYLKQFQSSGLKEEIDSSSIVGAGSIMEINFTDLSMNVENLKRMKDGLMGFRITGRIDYVDVFNEPQSVNMIIVNGPFVLGKGWPMQDSIK